MRKSLQLIMLRFSIVQDWNFQPVFQAWITLYAGMVSRYNPGMMDWETQRLTAKNLPPDYLDMYQMP